MPFSFYPGLYFYLVRKLKYIMGENPKTILMEVFTMKKAIRIIWIGMSTGVVMSIIIPAIFMLIVDMVYDGPKRLELSRAGSIYMGAYGLVSTAFMWDSIVPLFKWLSKKFRKETA